MTMTREQMIDEAVRRCLKPRTMKAVLSCAAKYYDAAAVAARVQEIRRDFVPGQVDKNGELLWTGDYQEAHPGWWDDSIDHRHCPFGFFPKRLTAIRAEFSRIAAAC